MVEPSSWRKVKLKFGEGTVKKHLASLDDFTFPRQSKLYTWILKEYEN